MNIEYIIVQAGGKGTRMNNLTRNKPKALVPVNNLPMLFHLFRKFPEKKFLIIGDYKIDVLRKYLAAFGGETDYEIIEGTGFTGTCSGISEAISRIKNNTSFMLIWSDLVLKDDFSPEQLADNNYVGLSGDFRCRWKYENGLFAEEPSVEHGVAGLFVFRDKSIIENVPLSGEFVRWLSEQNAAFKTVSLSGTKEYGLISEYNKLKASRCRPFNKIEEIDGKLLKTGIDKQGRELAVREKAWYRKAQELGFKNIPSIYSYDPLTMEYIDGMNIYEYTNSDYNQKKDILDKIIRCLKQLHNYESCPFSEDSFYEAYLGKTFDRLKKIQNLVPFADRKFITINGKKCHNIFFCREKLEDMFNSFKPDKFVLLHGDCTFSNLMLRSESNEPVLIDPRGYFGKTEFYGDPAYDWAKLYYSIAGNYDMFNLKKFDLAINEDTVDLTIESSGWEELSEYFLESVSDEVSAVQIKAIHAVIWLSLTTYAWEDYDSVCGAFYKGLLLLEDLL